MTQRGIRRLERPSLSEAVKAELVRLIAAGLLKPGQRLNEVHLAESFGVSRGPLREAARELEGEGLLISRPRQGFYVTDLTTPEIVDIYEVKRWVDKAIVHDFVTYSDRETCSAILADIDTIVREDRMPFSETLLAFRTRLAARMHNRLLAQQAMMLYRKFYVIAALIKVNDSDSRIARIIEVQRAFWTAMAEGDSERAIVIMMEDSDYWTERVTPYFADDTSRALAGETMPKTRRKA